MDIDLIGTEETMNSLDRKKIADKFDEVYKPNNMLLCVVGDADFNRIVEFVEKSFGSKKGSVPVQDIVLKNEFKTEKRMGLDQSSLVFGYHVPLAKDEKSYAAVVLSALTAEGMSSRLFSEIREKRNLSYSVKGGSNINKNFAYNYIYVGTKKENVSKVKDLIIREFKKVSLDLDEKELNSVKEQLIGQYQINMEESQIQLVNLLHSEICGDAKEFYEFEEEIRKVKLKDVKELARKVYEGDYSVFALVPE